MKCEVHKHEQKHVIRGMKKCVPRFLILAALINFEINFLSELFFYMPKKWRQKLKYPENKNSFWGEIKSVFHHFKETFSGKKLSQTLEYTFNEAYATKSEHWPLKKLNRNAQNAMRSLLWNKLLGINLLVIKTSTVPHFPWVQFFKNIIYVNEGRLLIFDWSKYT